MQVSRIDTRISMNMVEDVREDSWLLLTSILGDRREYVCVIGGSGE